MHPTKKTIVPKLFWNCSKILAIRKISFYIPKSIKILCLFDPDKTYPLTALDGRLSIMHPSPPAYQPIATDSEEKLSIHRSFYL